MATRTRTQEKNQLELYYTTHYNWEWIFQLSMKELQDKWLDKAVSCISVVRFQQLPSQTLSALPPQANGNPNSSKEKVQYSLFRIDAVLNSARILATVRVTSPIFQRIDAKDLFFYKTLFEYSRRKNLSFTSFTNAKCPYLPNTVLIPWNYIEELSVEEQRQRLASRLPSLPSYPAVLKAPMGSGGFGIYFVYHQDDIREVMNHHARRAKNDPSFLSRIEQLYEHEEIPLSWSLQEFLQPVKCRLSASNALQRTQVRAYVIECNDQLYLYTDYEVRCPSWDIPLETVLQEEQLQYGTNELRPSEPRKHLWEDEIENECCGDGFARPYNEKRNKKCTYRLMIDEAVELVPAIPTITEHLLACFQDLKEYLLQEKMKESGPQKSLTGTGKSTLAIIGIDLMVSERSAEKGDNSDEGKEYIVKIVEVNNNPAMPGKGKQMSDRYLHHLTEFQTALVALSLKSSGVDSFLMDDSFPFISLFKEDQSQKFIIL